MCRACWLRIAFSFAAYGAWLLCSAKAFRCSSLERQWFVREFPEGFHRTLLSSVEGSKTPRRLFVLRREAWQVFVSRGTRVFVTRAAAQPQGWGWGEWRRRRLKASAFKPGGDATRPNRALRDAAAHGSWLKNRRDASATAIGCLRLPNFATLSNFFHLPSCHPKG